MMERLCRYWGLGFAIMAMAMPLTSVAADQVTILRGGSKSQILSFAQGSAVTQGRDSLDPVSQEEGVTILRGAAADRFEARYDAKAEKQHLEDGTLQRRFVGGETLWIIGEDGTILTGCRVVNTGYVGGSRVQCSGPYYGY